jgi:hypothetical protein
VSRTAQANEFGSDEDIMAAVVQWCRQQPKEFFVEGFHRLVRQGDASFNDRGVCSQRPLLLRPEQVSFEQNSYFGLLSKKQ